MTQLHGTRDRPRLRLHGVRSASEACERVCAHLEHFGVMPSVYIERDGLLRCVAQRGLWQVLDGVPPGSGITGLAFQRGETVIVDDVVRAPQYMEAVPGIVAEACVPIFVGGRAVGALNVDSHQPLSDALVAEVHDCASTLAACISTFGLEHHPTPVRTLVASSIRLERSSDPEELFQVLLETALELSGLSTALAVSGVDEAAPTVHVRGPLAGSLARVPVSSFTALLTGLTGVRSCYSVSDDGGAGLPVTDCLRDAGARTIALLPIRTAFGSPALLLVLDDKREQLDTDRVELLELLVGHFADLADRRSSEAALRAANVRLEELATTDALTSLPNRARFSERLDDALSQACSGRRGVGVLFVDIDRFKGVNDSLGHECGDELLREVGRRLVATVRAGDTVARLGGDEFAVVLAGPTTPESAAAAAQRIVGCFRRSFSYSGIEFFTGASVGVALWPEDCGSKDELLKHADVAMYRAKGAGGNRFEMFQPTMSVAAHDRLRLETELHRAIGEGEFFLRYHPQVDLQTGAVVAVEALLRWAHPTRGELAPAQFLPLAEETGLIVPIGAWVLEEACRHAASWTQTAPERSSLRVAVNVSGQQLVQAGFARLVAGVIRSAGIPPRQLELEITEQTLISESGPGASALRALRAMGVGLAIDDFGTGYSSLAYLRRFPVDRLKLDMSFITGLRPDQAHERGTVGALVSAAVDLGHALGLEVIAEGVETEAQRRALASFGCEQGQGYLWAQPLRVDELGPWLAGRVATDGFGRRDRATPTGPERLIDGSSVPR